MYYQGHTWDMRYYSMTYKDWLVGRGQFAGVPEIGKQPTEATHGG